MTDVITTELDRQVHQEAEQPAGPVARRAQNYQLDSDRLVGLLLKLKLDFEESHFVTCDHLETKLRWCPAWLLCSVSS